MGYATLVEPLLVIEPIDRPLPALDGVQAVLLTSAHAVPALAAEARSLPVFTVGEATAKAARAAGCEDVRASAGNARDLATLIVATCRPEDGPMLHLAGDIVRPGLPETLKPQGFDYRRHDVYRALPRARLSDELVEIWGRHEIGAVLLFSPRTADIMVRLLIDHRLDSHVDSTAAICLSDDTATPCSVLTWRTICSAAQPNQPALIRALEGSLTIC